MLLQFLYLKKRKSVIRWKLNNEKWVRKLQVQSYLRTCNKYSWPWHPSSAEHYQWRKWHIMRSSMSRRLHNLKYVYRNIAKQFAKLKEKKENKSFGQFESHIAYIEGKSGSGARNEEKSRTTKACFENWKIPWVHMVPKPWWYCPQLVYDLKVFGENCDFSRLETHPLWFSRVEGPWHTTKWVAEENRTSPTVAYRPGQWVVTFYISWYTRTWLTSFYIEK